MGTGWTLVCDLGGVLLRWEPDVLLRGVLDRQPELWARPGLFPPGPVTVDALVTVVFQDFTPDSDWSAFDRGTLDAEGLIARVRARTGLDAAVLRALLDDIDGHLDYLAPTVHLVERLRAAGHRLVYLSNMPAPFADRLAADPRFTAWFEDGIFSSRVQQVKPEPEIYRTAVHRLGLDDGPVLMIDDRPVNLVPARALGWGGLHFRDADGCAAELERTGWL
ncbi:MAG: HAD-IA family hydrolase [Kineosporiaceae bacterium]